MTITIDHLPLEILFHVFSLVAMCGGRDFAAISQVSWKWYSLSEHNQLWNILYQTKFGTSVNSANNKSQFIKMREVHKKLHGKLYNIGPLAMNALHIACQDRWKCLEMIQTLLVHGMNSRDTTIGGQTALHTAVEYRNEPAVKLLLSDQKELVGNVDFQGRSLLHIAASKGDNQICLLLLGTGASPVCFDNQGQTPLHYASKCGHVQVCRLLAPLYGRNFIEHTDNNGNTALMLAATTNKQKCMKVLIEEFYANIDTSDLQGRTIMDSITRLMDRSTIKWAEEHQIWTSKSQTSHYNSLTEHEEWNRIAVRDQQRNFALANSGLLVHYR